MVVLEAKDFYLARKDEIWISESVLRYRLSCIFIGAFYKTAFIILQILSVMEAEDSEPTKL